MELKCSIKNVNGESFPNLEFKKLRQVVFFGENRKEISVYTTMIIAGSKERIDENKPIVSQLNDNFKLKIEFSIVDDSIGIKKQENEEYIDVFYEEIDKIQAIWGNGCKKIEKQEDVGKQLKIILNSEDINTDLTTIGKKEYFCIEDNTNEDDLILACPGKIEKDSNSGYVIQLEQPVHRGVDCIVCVKTTILLSQKMPPRVMVNVQLDLPHTGNVTLSYISVYICPAEGYHLGNDSKVKANLDNSHDNDSADEYNNLSEVAPRESTYYKEWVKKEHIMSRIIYRLNKEKLFNNQGKRIKNCRGIDIEFHMGPITEKGSPQFVLGALFSAAVTYGVDQGRLSLVAEGFVPYIPCDFQWLLLCFITFWAFIRWCSRKYNVNSEISNDKIWDGISLVVLVIGTVCGGLWAVVTLIVSRIVIESNWFDSFLGFYWNIAPWILAIAVICLLSYIIVSYTLMKRNYGRKPVSRELFY